MQELSVKKQNRLVQCWTCKKSFPWKSRSVKELSVTDVFFCSAECMLRHIKKLKNKRFTSWVSDGIIEPVGYIDIGVGDGVYYSYRLGSCFRSAFEVSVAEYLVCNAHIRVYYESFCLPMKSNSRGRRKVYIPDFFIPDHGIFIEVKGRWTRKGFEKFKYGVEVLGKERMLLFPSFYSRYFLNGKGVADGI